jgi:adenosylcobinamide-phosphate synthase
VEQGLYGPATLSDGMRRLLGGLALLLLVVPPVLVAWGLAVLPGPGPLVEVLLLYLALGATSLVAHAEAVQAALGAPDLELARQRVGYLVSRDTATLDAPQVSLATVESVLENGCDAVFGALCWFLLAGAPGVVLYRLVNTLDAMWGYRTPRYRYFGWAAARLDDLLNWLPARLTALSYTLLAEVPPLAWRCWQTQAPTWKSPNAGAVMAAGAGSLGLQLGGGAHYHGEWLERPSLGAGRAPESRDIRRAVQLVQRTLWLWGGLIVLGGWVVA